MPLGKLHNEWAQEQDNYDATDREVRVQAWQNLMAMHKCFIERLEWDQKKKCPKSIIKEVVGKPM